MAQQRQCRCARAHYYALSRGLSRCALLCTNSSYNFSSSRWTNYSIATSTSGRLTNRQIIGRAALSVYLSIDALDHLQRWIEAANLDHGPIFRGVLGPLAHLAAMDSSRVAVILKTRAKRAGLPKNVVAQLSGHSMRVGAAQDMAAAGIDLGAIMHAGGWKSREMVMRYIEHMDVQKSGMARLHGIAR